MGEKNSLKEVQNIIMIQCYLAGVGYSNHSTINKAYTILYYREENTINKLVPIICSFPLNVNKTKKSSAFLVSVI